MVLGERVNNLRRQTHLIGLEESGLPCLLVSPGHKCVVVLLSPGGVAAGVGHVITGSMLETGKVGPNLADTWGKDKLTKRFKFHKTHLCSECDILLS
jgi:hypothetical protein